MKTLNKEISIPLDSQLYDKLHRQLETQLKYEKSQ